MACRFEVMLSQEDAADMTAARSLDEADALEAILSVFRDTSDVADLNRRAFDEDVAVAPALFALLARARSCTPRRKAYSTSRQRR